MCMPDDPDTTRCIKCPEGEYMDRETCSKDMYPCLQQPVCHGPGSRF